MSKILLCSRGEEGAGGWLKWEGGKERHSFVFSPYLSHFFLQTLSLPLLLSFHSSSSYFITWIPFLQFALRARLAWRDSSRQFQSISSDSIFPWCISRTKLEFPPFCGCDLSASMLSPLSSCCYPDSDHYIYGPCMIGASHSTQLLQLPVLTLMTGLTASVFLPLSLARLLFWTLLVLAKKAVRYQ